MVGVTTDPSQREQRVAYRIGRWIGRVGYRVARDALSMKDVQATVYGVVFATCCVALIWMARHWA